MLVAQLCQIIHSCGPIFQFSLHHCSVVAMLKVGAIFAGSPMATNVVLLGLLLSDLRSTKSTKAFSFHNWSSSNAYRLVTIFYTITPWRIFKLSP